MAAVTQQLLLAEGVSASRTYLNNRQVNSTAGTSFTFSSIDTGSAGLLVIAANVAKASAATVTYSSITVAGNATTLQVQDTRTGSNSIACGATVIASIASVGGTQTIVVNMGASCAWCSIETWVLNNLISATPTATASGHNATTTTGDTSVSTNISVPNGGVLIASLQQQINFVLSTTNITYDQNAIVTGQGQGWAVGSDQHLSSSTVTLVNTDALPHSGGRITVAAAWN